MSFKRTLACFILLFFLMGVSYAVYGKALDEVPIPQTTNSTQQASPHAGALEKSDNTLSNDTMMPPYDEAIIDQAIVAHEGVQKTDQTQAVCVSFTPIGSKLAKPARGNELGEVTYYGWALYKEYSVEGYDIVPVMGSHTPVALTYNFDANGNQTLKEYWMPRDGSYYADDIYKKFPAALAQDGIDSQKFILRQIQKSYEQLIEQTGISAPDFIDNRLERLTEAAGPSSDPETIIEKNYVVYRDLLYFGDETLKYAASYFEQNPGDDLKGYVLAKACNEILSDRDHQEHVQQFSNGHEWYEQSKEKLLQVTGA